MTTNRHPVRISTSGRIHAPESDVLRACLDLLAVEKIWHERRNVLPVFVAGGRPVKVGACGTPDIFSTPIIKVFRSLDGMIYPDRGAIQIPGIWVGNSPWPVWVECKSSTGKQSEDQKIFQTAVEMIGHVYLLVRSSDELLEWLRQHSAVARK